MANNKEHYERLNQLMVQAEAGGYEGINITLDVLKGALDYALNHQNRTEE